MLFQSSLLAVGALATLAVASPERMVREKRAETINDVEILNYALTLEYLERDFYAEGLKKFKQSAFADYPSDTYSRLQQIASHEVSHVSLLAGALGSSGVSECKYNFGITDVPTFLGIARILESVGVTAYLGAAPDIKEKAYLATAGSILTVESRHASYLNELTGISGFPAPYDPALFYSQVYTLAAGFIVPGSCGTSGSLPPGIHAYPTLTVKTAKPVAGKKLGLHFPLQKGYNGPYYATFISGFGTTYAQINMSNGVVTVPTSLAGTGLNFLIITKTKSAPTDANTLAGPAPVFF